MPHPLDRPLALLAALSALTVAALLASALAAGISQEAFQVARLAGPNAERLLLAPAGLRLNLGLDNLFIVLYAAFFVLLAVRLGDLLAPAHRAVALGALLLTALLDAAENHHILAMLFSAEQRLPLSVGESQLQMAASAVKFQASYVGLVLFAFGLYRLGGIGRPLAWGIWLLYVPLGIVIWIVPPESVRPLVILRTLSFIAAFVAVALLLRRPAVAPQAA
ncbi:MAG: hypothetical protein U1E23_06700 [Reyranellaceae bacterium]